MNILDYQYGPFEGMLSAAEAAEIWGIDPSAIRKAIIDGRLIEGKDCRKFGKQWVVTTEAMKRTFHGGWEPWSKYLRELRKERQQQEGY